jgi:hypothetical protein
MKAGVESFACWDWFQSTLGKRWTARCTTKNYQPPLLRNQPKDHRRQVVWIGQREKKTPKARVLFVALVTGLRRLPSHRREAPENVALRVADQHQSIGVIVAAAVKIGGTEACS